MHEEQRKAREKKRPDKRMEFYVNFKQAQNLFNLPNDYTETDVKKSYRTLMLQYHTDSEHGNEEFAQKINLYRDVLMQQLEAKKKAQAAKGN